MTTTWRIGKTTITITTTWELRDKLATAAWWSVLTVLGVAAVIVGWTLGSQ